ncbi:MAG: ATP-binding protein, partial [Myxococcales bacterium]|nr:ATP-binding protein [Myxococcales bacterium]
CAGASPQGRLDASGLAERIEPRFGLADLVLPDKQSAQIGEVRRAVAALPRAYGAWGLGRALGEPGISALFAGPPGTGKTMAAECLAADLELPIYRVDLSQVVSKYIGETEKNLREVFAAAEARDLVLFFDEADAIFGKRSEIKDAHDRYANIEVSYLLQRIETYPGIVILASNFRKNLDEAFMRRLQVIVELGLPGEEERATIWRGIWPADAPLADDFDADELARRFEISGGHIRNIAVSAAFAAAEAGTAIGMAEILCAAQSEYRKIGKLVSADRFQVPAPRERRS